MFSRGPRRGVVFVRVCASRVFLSLSLSLSLSPLKVNGRSEVSVNQALKKEMTGYLSRGLQKSAGPVTRSDPDLTRGFRRINLRDPDEDPEILVLTPARFVRLVFGFNSFCCSAEDEEEGGVAHRNTMAAVAMRRSQKMRE